MTHEHTTLSASPGVRRTIASNARPESERLLSQVCLCMCCVLITGLNVPVLPLHCPPATSFRPLAFNEPAPFTPHPMGGQPTHPSTSGGCPPQKANKYSHPEVPTGVLTQPSWHTPTPPLLSSRSMVLVGEMGWFGRWDLRLKTTNPTLVAKGPKGFWFWDNCRRWPCDGTPLRGRSF